jgi:hypothetical protein
MNALTIAALVLLLIFSWIGCWILGFTAGVDATVDNIGPKVTGLSDWDR